MKSFFMKRALREKVLLTAFVLLALLMWTGRGWTRSRVLWADWRKAGAELATQELWLQHGPAIDVEAVAATKSLEPSKTLNAARLVGELNALAGRAGMTTDISGQRTERTTQFAFHSVEVNIRRTDLATLLRFYRELSLRAPYIVLEQFSLAVDRTSSGQLNASLRVVSVELDR